MQRIATIPCEPAAPMLHRFRSDDGEHLLVIPYSRLFDLSPELARVLERGGAECDDLVRALAQPAIGEDPLDDVVAPQP